MIHSVKSILLVLPVLVVTVFPGVPVRAAQKPSFARAVEEYKVPDVTLINQEGKKVKLRRLLLDSKKPVLVDFVYTTCTTICPVLSANFANFQRRLGSKTDEAHLVSISIDPEHDRPKEMKAYLKRYRAKPGWDFLTGSRRDMDRVIRAFNALYEYSINKMEHYPLILLKSPTRKEWVRISGLIGTTDLMKEYEGVRK